MKTKQEFQEEIEVVVEKRREVLSALVEATQHEIDEDEVLDLAEEAFEHLVKIREIRDEMRKFYPKVCNCNCHKEGETK